MRDVDSQMRDLERTRNREQITALADRWEPPVSFEQLAKPLQGWSLDNIKRNKLLHQPVAVYRVALLRDRDGAVVYSENEDIFLAMVDARSYALNMERREASERDA